MQNRLTAALSSGEMKYPKLTAWYHGLRGKAWLGGKMAQTIRFGIFVLSACLAALAFFTLKSFWEWVAPLVIFIAGSMLAEFAFNRLASTSTKQRDLEDRTRNPPV
jgi:hypothetical protein